MFVRMVMSLVLGLLYLSTLDSSLERTGLSFFFHGLKSQSCLMYL
jgi:hypothetical protein